ncbi:hypothetical protein C1645_39919 [Glomus cerebriforme]|uniref:Uncharacterized protein n=1 Tax=Glomus cerebriforme TaxID=658196 RepID=A0A397T3H5_9GLOM|nr:hypothetical protein C1645_39919 [Glomus cerebriforme]
MDSIYQLQFPLFHAKTMVLGFWTTFYSIVFWNTIRVYQSRVLVGDSLYNFRNAVHYAIPLNLIILFYAFFMLKGVRDESKKIYIVYFGNLFQAVLLYKISTDFCYLQNPTLQFCFKYETLFNSLFGLTVLFWIIIILSTWNTVRCQRNFGKNLGFYLKYEPIPDEFKSENFIVILPFCD